MFKLKVKNGEKVYSKKFATMQEVFDEIKKTLNTTSENLHELFTLAQKIDIRFYLTTCNA